MQPRVEKKGASSVQQPKPLLDRLESLVQKNEHAYNDAIRDFRDHFTLGSKVYETNCD
jgi:hypothetical protein